jgi:hypothetical protein
LFANVPYFSSPYLRFMTNDPQPLSVCKQSMPALYDMHCFNLDNKIAILGRLFLFGFIPVLAKQSILRCAVKYLELDISGCLSQFLALRTKVYMFIPHTQHKSEYLYAESCCAPFFQQRLIF